MGRQLSAKMGQPSVWMVSPLLREALPRRHPIVVGMQLLQPSNLLLEMGCTPRQQGSPHPTPPTCQLQTLQAPLQTMRVGSGKWVRTKWGGHQISTTPINPQRPMGSAGVHLTTTLQKRNAQFYLQLPSSPCWQMAHGPCQEDLRGVGPLQRGKAGRTAGGLPTGMRLRRTRGRSVHSSGSLPWCRACSGCG